MLEYFVPTDNFYGFLGYVSANIAEKITGTFLINSNRRLSGEKEHVEHFKHIPQSRQNRDLLKKHCSNVFLLIENF